ncbi:MAG: protein-export chaperone SecB [Methylococcales bacterium]|jgi:preprotein translocase subunit SecB|nr:protein-export chaperone SecB [Methylococcales bacterium]MBT3815042.1 protein-export chaperone SecB [Methylococcales bacterium]MBT4031834.1 protein-export chaperone SecB [Methylococcales bacterium]MBT4348892.1 protein-export chaperone SecB [Methylococcales bacterium]MBT4600019.1 protein-export chaperone SecB [Methylococcales bacterium]
MAEQEEKKFSIQKIFCKDVSFETPNSPKIFTQKWQPEVDFNLGTHVEPIDDDVFEVAITVTVTVKIGDQVAYLAEVVQAGIFTLKGFTDAERGPLLGSYSPSALFPYAREAISDLVSKGGFPQLLLAPVNFDAVYAQHVQQQSAPNTVN